MYNLYFFRYCVLGKRINSIQVRKDENCNCCNFLENMTDMECYIYVMYCIGEDLVLISCRGGHLGDFLATEILLVYLPSTVRLSVTLG